MNIEQARFNMIEQQIRPWEVLDPQVLDLLFVVKREDFTPPPYRNLAFADIEIPIGSGKAMSASMTPLPVWTAEDGCTNRNLYLKKASAARRRRPLSLTAASTARARSP